jgi:hypothetical protein
MQSHLPGPHSFRKHGNDHISSTGDGRSIPNAATPQHSALSALVRPSSSGAELVAGEESKQRILRGDLTHALSVHYDFGRRATTLEGVCLR